MEDDIATSEDSDEQKVSFDEVIGHIENILMESKFQETQQYFLENYWREFDTAEENKLSYMEIFNEYHKAIESYIENSLKIVIPGFSMEGFIRQLSARSPEVEGEVFEVLETFTDFLAFKEMILDYRAVKEGRVQDLSSGISITSMRNEDIDEHAG